MLIPATLAAVVPPGAAGAPVNDGGTGCSVARDVAGDRHLRRWHSQVFRPFAFQDDIVQGLLEKCERRDARGLLLLPTGAGKTSVTVAALLKDLSRCAPDDSFAVWIAPQRELLLQARQCFETLWSSGLGPDSLDLRVVVGSTVSPPPRGRHSVMFATPQSAVKFLASHRALGRVTHAVFDEAHHLGAERFGDAWQLIAGSESVRLALGLSATPMRGDEESFVRLRELFRHRLLFSRRLGRDPVLSLQREGVLARVAIDVLDGVPDYIREMDVLPDSNVVSLAYNPRYWLACINAISRCSGRSICFYPDTSTGRLASAHLRSLACTAEYVDGEEPIATRVAVLERFRDGKTRCVVSVGLLFEGVDLPTATDAFVVYRVSSGVRLSQIVGRVIRGPALGGSPAACIHCADAATVAAFGDPNSGRDYAAYWSRGIPL